MELELTQCPECGQTAEVIRRFTQPSTDGPVDMVKVRCVTGRWFVTLDADAGVKPAPCAPSAPAARPEVRAQRRASGLQRT